jgi:CRP-like cAMP-binding protein
VVLSTSLDWQRGRSLAAALAAAERPAWVRTTAAQLLALQPPQAPAALPLAALPEFEKRVVLATSDFFHRTWTDTLDLLADHAEIRSFAAGEAITAAGDSCRELLLLIEGEARVEERSGDQVRFRALRAGQVLDELEVLTHSNSENTIVAETAGTRVLAVPVDCFDATLERDPDFARRVLALETRQLQRVTRELPAAPLG